MRQRGFSLPELLVALLLGSVLLGGALGMLAAASRSVHANDSAEELQERAAYLLAALESDIQHAGYFGLAHDGRDFGFLSGGVPDSALPPGALRQSSPPLAALPASAQACGDNFAIDLAQPIGGDNNGFALGRNRRSSCAPRDGARAGADTLILRRASTANASAETGRLQLLVARLDARQRWLLLDGMLPAAPALQAARVQLHDLEVHSYYVANSSVGDASLPSLRLKSLTRVSGSPAFVDTEVMPGVEDLQLRLLTSAGAREPGSVPPDESVRAVQLWLLLRAARPEAGFADDASYAYADRVMTLSAAQRRFRRLLVTRTIALRNAIAD